MKVYLVLILVIFANVGHAQQFSYPSIKASANTIDEFIPKGWTILDSATGDLNKDNLDDAAIVLLHKDSVSWVSSENDTTITQPRILIILFKDQAGGYTLAEQSNTFILIDAANAYSDNPFEDIIISTKLLRNHCRGK